MFLAASSVAMLAWPRLQASYRFLPVDIAVKRYYQTSEIPTERLPVLIRFSNEAIDYHDHYRFHDKLSMLHWLRALDPLTPALQRRDEYLKAEQEAVETVRRNPGAPAVWSRIALIRWILHDEPENILGPWKMSIFSGRTTAPLISQRVEIGLAYHPFLDDEGVAMLRDQLLLAWRMQPGSLMKVLAARDRSLQITRELLAQTAPDALAEMEVWIERFP